MPSNNFKVGEMLNKRTSNTKTWMNFDGSYTTEIHSGIVHFDDGLSNLHNINTSLFDEADADTYEGPTSRHGKYMLKHEKEKVKDKKKKGKMNRDDFDYQVPTLPFSIQIPKNIKKGYSIGQNDEFVRFIPQNVSPSKGYVNKAKTNEIQYQDAWNDTDIILEVTDRGIKETMILKTDRAPFAFSFEVDGVIEDDLTMGNMKLEPAWLIDAVGEKRDVSQTIRREGDQTFIDFVADVEGLVYPIEIDPTVTIQPDGTAGKDAYIGQLIPDSSNETATLLYCGSSDTQYSNYRPLIQMDLSSIPSNVYIINSKMVLYCSGGNTTSTIDIVARAITSSWSDAEAGGVSWNNMPTYETNRASIKAVSTYGTYYDWDITGVTNDWINGVLQNYGLIFINSKENTVSTNKAFGASENGTVTARPKLEVSYNLPPTAPTVITPNGGETWNSSHTVEWVGAIDPKEEENVTFGVNSNSAHSLVAGQPKIAQTFVVSRDFDLKEVEVRLNSTGYVDVQVWETDGTRPITMIETRNVYQGSPGSYVKAVFGKTGLLTGVKYAIVISRVASDNTITGDNFNLYPNGNIFTFNGTSWSEHVGTDMMLKLKIDVYSINLRYEIQLSTDNGANWSDIVALTTAGATQYIHDFINAPQTSTAKIRVRAFDGSAYGPWDESDGVFSIIHNVAPSAPTNLTPVTTKDRADVIRFTWQHNDPNADAQSKFDLDYRLQGSTNWNTVTQNTVNQFYDLPAGSLPRGTIEWRVRTYDQADLSGPYSELKTFFAGDKPSKPTTVSPVDGSIVSVSNPTVQWSSVGQVGYNLKVLDATETEVLWETNQTSNNKAHTIGYSLENETDYAIQLTIKNVDGINSNVEESHIHVSYTPPAIPIVMSSKEESALVIEITNPIPSGTEPNVSYNSLFRRKIGNVKFNRIANDLPYDGIFTDYTVASGQDYEYQVRAFGDNGTFRDSLINTYGVSFENVRLNIASQPDLQVELKFNGERSFDTSFQSTQSQFAGRKRPVTEFGIMVNNKMDLNYVVDPVEIKKLREILYKRETLLYRDSRGRKFYVTAGNFSVSDDMEFDYYEVTLPLSEVDYTEEV